MPPPLVACVVAGVGGGWVGEGSRGLVVVVLLVFGAEVEERLAPERE